MAKMHIDDTNRLPTRVGVFSLFFIAILAYVAWRWSAFLVWDDTSSASFNLYANNGYFSLERIRDIFVISFANIQGDGYRPISAIIRGIGNAYVYSNGIDTHLLIVINGILFGITVVAMLMFSHFYLKTSFGKALALFLFLASTPVLSSALVLFSGIQFLAFIAILMILNIYLQYDRYPRNILLIPLGLLLLIGPWIREIVGIAPALILINEVLHRRGFRAGGVLAALGFLHALFPTFIVSFLVKSLPIAFVFNIGNLASFLQTSTPGGGIFSKVANLHWRIFADLFSILPPSLVIAGMIIFSYAIRSYRQTDSNEFRQQIFLLIFFIVAFLPFLKIFNEQVHLAYSLIPLSVLLARQVEFCFDRLRPNGFGKPILAIQLLIAVSVLDHGVNIFSVRGASLEIYRSINSIAKYFIAKLPARSIVISNAQHLEDIRFYSKNHIDPWAYPGGIPDRRQWLYNADDLQRLVDNNKYRQIYLLDARRERTKGQRDPRVLGFVRDQIIDMEPQGLIVSTSYVYPFFDPLRLLLPTFVATWPGPPDLEFDFYRGPALSDKPFLREVAVDYYLYRVTGAHVFRWMPHPVLLVQNYHDFNIVGYRDIVYAIPQAEGAFDFNRAEQKGYSRSYKGNDVESVKARIRESL
jgi:hypothetical protein